jgi:hypothetical protein
MLAARVQNAEPKVLRRNSRRPKDRVCLRALAEYYAKQAHKRKVGPLCAQSRPKHAVEKVSCDLRRLLRWTSDPPGTVILERILLREI